MIHAQCSINPIGRGDVIVLALPDHPWGTLDRKHLLIVEWDDSVLEQRLLDRRKGGEQFPVMVYPYAVRDANGDVVERSSKTLDLDAMQSRGTVIDPTIEKPILAIGDYSLKLASAEEVGIVATVINVFTAPFKAAWNWMVG